MPDFYKIAEKPMPGGRKQIFARFLTGKKKDLMIKGGGFYAVWVEEKNVWSKDEDDVIYMVDRDIDKYIEAHRADLEGGYYPKYMRYSDTGAIDDWHKYVTSQQRDRFVLLDQKLIFAGQTPTRDDYVTKTIPYALQDGPTEAWDKLTSVLYSLDGQHKIMWSIGSIVTGESKVNQKFVVFYGDRGTGKSTIIGTIDDMFKGFTAPFQAKALGSKNEQFAMEPFKDGPLIAIQHDGKLSEIEDNTRLNSLVSHEPLNVNSKYDRLYSTSFNSFLIIGTNEPVKITDSKSGILRRLIDIIPTGHTIKPYSEYKRLIDQVKFEYGAIAYKCAQYYNEHKRDYDDYIPVRMLAATNDMYNFVFEKYYTFKEEDGVSLQLAYDEYKKYCDRVNIKYPQLKVFREEFRTYFWEFLDRYDKPGEGRVRSYFKGFKHDQFEEPEPEPTSTEEPKSWIIFKAQPSLLDDFLKDCPAQLAVIEDDKDRPAKRWSNCKTKLKDIDTTELHYVLPTGHDDLIRIDFDLKGKDGKKDPDLNLKEASKWPRTYAERSKSGAGIHLYYLYSGDANMLDPNYADDIEVKVQKGNSSIRRKLTVCNDIPVSTITSGLPLIKGDDKKVVDTNAIYTDKQLHNFIKSALMKKHPPNHTITEMQLMKTVLDRHYNSGVSYDVSDMKDNVRKFAASSSNSSKEAIKIFLQLHFKSEDKEVTLAEPADDRPITIFDIEVYPNLFLICWSTLVSDEIHVMKNPSPEEVTEFLKMKLVGFNNRRYDNHIVVYRAMGKSIKELYDISQRIINKNDKDAYNFEGWNASYTDLYDLASTKQSLKRWEIEMDGVTHKEMSLRWDKPVPDDKIDQVIQYCKYDVMATKALWFKLKSDIVAREMLADLTGLTMNTKTNTLTEALIFGKGNKTPQSEFNYRDLSKPVTDGPRVFTAWNGETSSMPFFPGYYMEAGKSYYRGELVSEGGYVYSEKGVYCNVALLDVTSMHPSSIRQERLFGKYTDIYGELVDARVYIKRAVSAYKKEDMKTYDENVDTVRKLPHIGAKLSKYLNNYEDIINLPQALKIAINSVYGLTAASFPNPFRDPRNKDNIVAKRGALFMIDLKNAVQERGFTVAHIKTDSIKIPNATPEIIQFVMDFGKKYGYNFEHEDTYSKMALVNKAVYIAKYKEPHKDKNTGNDILWTATGTQFQVPYVFKTLFSKEPIEFKDLCETRTSNEALYLDFNESLPTDEHNYQFVGKVGQFCPIKSGFDGAELYWQKDENTYNSVTGTKGWRWKESDVVRTLGIENQVDTGYYDEMCRQAIADIDAVGEPFGQNYKSLIA